MEIKKVQNTPNFKARIGDINSHGIAKHLGEDVLKNLKAFLPRLKDEAVFGDKTVRYEYDLSNSKKSLFIICYKDSKREYPKAKTIFGHLLNKVKSNLNFIRVSWGHGAPAKTLTEIEEATKETYDRLVRCSPAVAKR